VSHLELRICNMLPYTEGKGMRLVPPRVELRDPDPLYPWKEFFDNSSRVQIHWANDSGSISGQMDALELAEKCDQIWHKFLKKRLI
jgi:hypothetical protein